MNPWIMVGICFASALLLLVCLRHEDRIYRVIGICLILLGIYKAADAVTDEALSFSWLIWVKRAALLVMAIYAGWYAWNRWKHPPEEQTAESGQNRGAGKD